MKLQQALTNSSLKSNSFSSEEGQNCKIATRSILGPIKKSLVDVISPLGVTLPMLR